MNVLAEQFQAYAESHQAGELLTNKVTSAQKKMHIQKLLVHVFLKYYRDCKNYVYIS